MTINQFFAWLATIDPGQLSAWWLLLPAALVAAAIATVVMYAIALYKLDKNRYR